MRSYTPRGGDRREYIGESGVYNSTAREYIAESGVYIWQFTTAAQRNGFGLANSPQSSLGEPLPALQSPRTVLTASTTAHTNFPGYSIQCLLAGLNHVRVDRRATASRHAASHYPDGCRR